MSGEAEPNPLVSAISSYLPGFAPRTIFDVGANIGQSALAFAAAFPEAQIFAFEPISETFGKLQAAVGDNAKIKTFRLALGRALGTADMLVNPRSPTGNRMANRPPRPGEFIESVSTNSGDTFVAAQKIGTIDILKVDTEGHDLAVLMGFGQTLRTGRVTIAEAEVSMNPHNTKHVPFEHIKGFMEAAGFLLFHIHEPVLDIAFSGRPILRRCNVAFISARVAEERRQPKAQRRT